MNIPSTSSSSSTSLDASQTSSSFLATVRNRLGGSSFALPSLLNNLQDGSQPDSEPRLDGQEHEEEEEEEEDEDLEGMMWDAQKALISHNTPLAISLYSKALLLSPSSNPSPAAALALGNLLSRGPDDRHLQVVGGGRGEGGTATKSKMKKRREWETMNRAAGVYLVGLAGELERAGVVVVGKERESGGSSTNGTLVGKGGEVGSGKILNPAVALENAHELASHLLSLYRRGLVHPSDPPVPLPIPPPHHHLLSPEQGDSKKNTNIWQLAQYLAGEALAVDWNLKEQTMPLESPGRGEHSGSSARSEALKRSLKMHLHYLLALTSHATSPHESLDNFRTLLTLGPSNIKEATELLTSAQERVVSLEKRIASLERSPSQPPSPSVATLSPYPSTASTSGPSTAMNGKGNGNGSAPLSRTTRTPATPFTLSPQTTPTHQHALPSFPFPRQPPLPLPSTAATTPTLATTQTSLAFPSSSSNNLPSSSSSSSNLRTYSRSPSLMSLQPQVTDQPFPFRLTRRTSTFSAKSGISLSPSMLSMRLSGSRSGVVEGTIDESVIAEGAVSKVLPSSRTGGGGGAGSWVGSWFGGKKAGAEGSLRRLAVSSSRTMRGAGIAEGEVDVERGERIGSGYANGKGKGRERPRIQSMFEAQPSREEDEERQQQPESSTSTSTRPSASSSTTRPFTPKASSPLPPSLSPSHFLPPPATSTSTTTTPNSTAPPSPSSTNPSSQPSPHPRPTHPPQPTASSTLSLLSPPPTRLNPKPNNPTISSSQSQPSSPRTKLAAASSHLRSPPSNPHLSRFGDQALDPQLRQLEMDSIITKGVSCGVCEREGVNLPACPRCGVRFCSRECRVGELGAGDGKKHVCGLLEKRKVSSSSSSVVVPLTVVAGNHTPRRRESGGETTTTVQKAIVV